MLTRAICAHWQLLRPVAKVTKRRSFSSPVKQPRGLHWFWIDPREAFFLPATHQRFLSRTADATIQPSNRSQPLLLVHSRLRIGLPGNFGSSLVPQAGGCPVRLLYAGEDSFVMYL